MESGKCKLSAKLYTWDWLCEQSIRTL